MYKIEVMSFDLAKKYLNDIIKIEEEVTEKMHDIFSPEVWREKQILMDLPGKWQMSVVCLSENVVCGYMFASHLTNKCVHINRAAVGISWQSHGIGSDLLRFVYENTKSKGYK